MNLSSPLRRLSGHLLDLILAVVTLLIGWLIWSLIVWARGQTPGKQLLGMRVIRSDTTVLYLWLLWGDESQELWDKMATTLVVDDPQRVLARP